MEPDHPANTRGPASAKQYPIDIELAAAADQLAKMLASDVSLKAEIVLPSESRLKVRLVKLDDLLAYRHLSGDEAFISAIFFTLLGALLGIGVNLVTNSSLSLATVNGATWTAIIASVLGLSLLVIYWTRLRRRLHEAETNLFAIEDSGGNVDKSRRKLRPWSEKR